VNDYEEQAWVLRAQNGDNSALDGLIRLHHPYVLNVVRRIVRDHDDANDVAQEVFRIFLESLPGFRGDSRLRTWLHRVAINAALMHVRKSSGRARFEGPSIDSIELCSPQVGAEDLMEYRRLLSRVHQVWPSLCPTHREILTKRAIEDLSIVDIATELKLSVSATKSRISRARTQLQNEMRGVSL
jgi:RNA polymerase sigma-70 factor (ECF subfamily)